MPRYTEEEKATLEKLAATKGLKACYEYMPHKHWRAVKAYVYYRGWQTLQNEAPIQKPSGDVPHIIINGEVCYPKPPGRRHAAYMAGGEE